MVNINVRSYCDADFEQVTALLKDESTYGGHYDEERDNYHRLNSQIAHSPNSVLIAEIEGEIVGSISLLWDKRSAWFFRFAVKHQNGEVARALLDSAKTILKENGHNLLLGYSPVGDDLLDARYNNLGMKPGGDYTNYWIEF